MAETPTSREKAAQAYQEKLARKKDLGKNVTSEKVVAVGSDIRKITVLKNGNKHSTYICTKKQADAAGVKYGG